MDKALEEKVSDILSSPEDLKKIMDIAKSLGLGGAESKEEKSESSEKESVQSVEGIVEGNEISAIEKLIKSNKNERVNLLEALKPYLKEEKRSKVESLLKMIKAAEIIFSAKSFF